MAFGLLMARGASKSINSVHNCKQGINNTNSCILALYARQITVLISSTFPSQISALAVPFNMTVF